MSKHTHTISDACRVTGRIYTVTVLKEDYAKYVRGEATVENAFPYLSEDDRDFLISRISPEGRTVERVNRGNDAS